MALVAAYWHPDGLDIYRYVNDKPVKLASGSLEGLKPVKAAFDKKVLIVGRELLLHMKKKYPPAQKEKLTLYSRATQLGLAAAQLALNDARLSDNDLSHMKIGTCVGTTFGSIQSIEDIKEGNSPLYFGIVKHSLVLDDLEIVSPVSALDLYFRCRSRKTS
jgi:3-oxoacyl-(acyl-carrier-protein) synthase